MFDSTPSLLLIAPSPLRRGALLILTLMAMLATALFSSADAQAREMTPERDTAMAARSHALHHTWPRLMNTVPVRPLGPAGDAPSSRAHGRSILEVYEDGGDALFDIVSTTVDTYSYPGYMYVFSQLDIGSSWNTFPPPATMVWGIDTDDNEATGSSNGADLAVFVIADESTYSWEVDEWNGAEWVRSDYYTSLLTIVDNGTDSSPLTTLGWTLPGEVFTGAKVFLEAVLFVYLEEGEDPWTDGAPNEGMYEIANPFYTPPANTPPPAAAPPVTTPAPISAPAADRGAPRIWVKAKRTKKGKQVRVRLSMMAADAENSPVSYEMFVLAPPSYKKIVWRRSGRLEPGELNKVWFWNYSPRKGKRPWSFCGAVQDAAGNRDSESSLACTRFRGR